MNKLNLVTCAFWAICSVFADAQVKDHSVEKRIIDAVQMYKDGKLSQATVALEQMLLEHPKDADVEAWLGFLYERQNQSIKALPLLESAAAQRPKDLEVATNLGNAYFATGQFTKALTCYKSVELLNSKMFEPYYNSGTIYVKRKDYAKAIEEFLKASSLKPDDPYVFNNLGVAYESSRVYVRAVQAYKRAAQLQPENGLFARNVGLLLAHQNQFAESVTYLEKASAKQHDAAITLVLAETYAKLGRREDAIRTYDNIRLSQAKNVTYWFNLAILRSQSGDIEGSELAYRQVLELNPSDLDTLNNLGLLLYKKHEYAQALLLFDKLSGLNPTSTSAKMNLAAAAMRSGDVKRAIAAWKELVRIEPQRTSTRLDLANALWGSGDFEGARFHYLEVLKNDKSNAEALNGIGLYHLRGGHFPQAEAAFRSSIEANLNFVPAYNNLAITLERMNQRNQAIAVLEKATKIDPNDPDVKRNLRRIKASG